jgi:steroid 5-alpha reductase family enzyme
VVTVLPFIAALVSVSVAFSAAMAAAWWIQQRTQNSGWVDAVWTFSLGGIGVAGALAPITDTHGSFARQAVVAALVAIWSIRLGSSIVTRTAARPDDPRCAELQRAWGADARRQMFWLLQKQALVSIPLAMAILLAAHHPESTLRAVDMLGALLILIGIGGEALADHQLHRFTSDPSHRGRICDVGLWSWSRHPNYFFEWFGWLGYALIAIDLTGVYPMGLLALLAPAVMYWLLVHVSGIPPLEDHMRSTRGAVFAAYAARTSAFFPWPPVRDGDRRP